MRANVLIVPGQTSAERRKSLAAVFENGRSPIGLVHVVSWGFNEVWDRGSDVQLDELRSDGRRIDDPNSQLREVQLQTELKDFKDLCARLRQPWVHRRLKWLVIAVAKSDLFWSKLAVARNYYIPGGPQPESGFCRELRRLTGNKSDYPSRLAILPFSAYPSRHTFSDDLPAHLPELLLPQVTALRNNFCQVIGRLI